MVVREIKKLDLSARGNDLEFWMTRAPVDRLAALAVLRDRYARLKNMEIQTDFKDFITLLNRHEVIYLVVGGFAVAYHGYPRFTGDIDFWLKIDPKNAEQTIKALNEFGFGGSDLSAQDFLKPDHVVQLGYPPNRIDLLTTVTGLDFDECWQKREAVEFEGVTIHFLSLNHLKLNKRLVARKQDDLDLENLP